MSTNGEAQSSGGGIYSAGHARIKRSTLNANSAHANGDGVENTGTLSLTNSTVSGNGSGEGSGGGISNTGTLTVTNSTLSRNTAAGGGGGIDNQGSATLTGTILAENTSSPSAGPDCTGSISSGGYNLIGESSGCTFTASTGDQVGPVSGQPIDPMIGDLMDNGGPTWTMALLTGSPATDTIPTVTCTAFLGASPIDQRGVTRPQGSACDTGAFELQP